MKQNNPTEILGYPFSWYLQENATKIIKTCFNMFPMVSHFFWYFGRSLLFRGLGDALEHDLDVSWPIWGSSDRTKYSKVLISEPGKNRVWGLGRSGASLSRLLCQTIIQSSADFLQRIRINPGKNTDLGSRGSRVIFNVKTIKNSPKAP